LYYNNNAYFFVLTSKHIKGYSLQVEKIDLGTNT
jgi:hypothetical protein